MPMSDIRAETAPVFVGIGGDSGSGKSTLAAAFYDLLGAERITTVCLDDYHSLDRRERALIGITPLNPRANNFALMEEQLWALKRGEAIAKPVYDHADGTFKAPVRVEPNEVVIVQGLHPFLLPGVREAFDLKVWLDPETKLRIKWKLQRDIAKRGYDESQVLAEIEARGGDAEAHIQPQRAQADLVVRFSSPNHDLLPGAADHLNVRLTQRHSMPQLAFEHGLDNGTTVRLHNNVTDDDGRQASPTRRWATTSRTTCRRTPTSWPPSGSPAAGVPPEEAGAAVAGESSTATWTVVWTDRLTAMSTTRPSATGSSRCRAAEGQYIAYIAYDLDLFEEGSIANLTSSIIGNVFGFKALKALRLEDMRIPLALRQDVPGPAARHRDGARVPQQVRPAAARRTTKPKLGLSARNYGRVVYEATARRARLHQGRREHQLQPFMRWRDRFLLLHGGGQPGQEETGEIKGHYSTSPRRRWRTCTSGPSSPRSSAASSS
jgi:uridine kinase